MAKKNNEAKIRFTAETGSFNDSIKQATSEMSKLQAELKLNAEQMKTTGTNAEGLERKHEILTAQLSAAHDKTEALSEKLAKAKEIFGENSEEVSRLETQLINAQIAEERIKQAINECETALSNHTAETEDSRNALEKLTDEIDNQKTELKNLKDEYQNAVLEYGETSDEARNLERAIGNLSGELRENQQKLSDVANRADELDRSLDEAGDGAREAGEGFTIMKGVVADLASSAIQSAIGKISEFCGWLAQLPEQTRELRQDFATLETSFDNVGFSTETATETWKDLYAVFGEDDRAVETANNIAKMADSQEDLNDWVTITTGVWGTYQDSLPVEGLAETSMETAKTGTVTGGLADALNWSSEAAKMFSKYMEEGETAEDGFNKALAECTSEQERQQLITDTLTKLYGGAAETYRDTSKAQMEAKEATAENTLAEAELAESIEPLTTAFTEFKTALLVEAKPAIEAVSGAMLSALDWAKEHPTAMKIIGAALIAVGVAFTTLTGIVIAYTVAQWAMNAAVLANPITWIIVAIVAGIALLVAGFVLLWNKCEGFRNFFINAWEMIKSVWNEVQPYFEVLWTAVKAVFSVVVEQLIANFKIAWEAIKLVWSVAVSWFQMIWDNIKQVFSVVKAYFEGAFRTAKEAVELIWSAVTGFFQNIWNTIKGIFSAVKAVLSGDFQGAWDAIKGIVGGWTSYFSGIWQGIKNVFASVKSWFSNTFSAAFSAVKNIWSNISGFFSGLVSKIQSAVSNVKNILTKPFDAAKDAIVKVVDKIKSVFGGMKLSFPNIKMPHFSIKPSGWKIGDLLEGSIPKLGIEWYKEGGIMTKPTIFGMNGNSLMAGGEAGAEAILPIDKLEGYISDVVERSVTVVNLQSLADSIEELASRPIEMNINGRQFAMATASDGDNVNGLRSTFKSRGLAIE